jgi:myo-inositol catabolism protein IolS
MEQTELGRSGIKISRLGIGAWQAGGKQWGEDVRDADCIAAIIKAHNLGINFVDSAEVYGNGHSEEVLSKALAEIGRDEMVVATKVAGSHLRHDEVLKACDASLKRLGTDVIDLYQIHWPSVWEQVPLKETMKALEKLHKEGKIRAIGVSNFAVRDMEEARSALSSTDISSNQVQYSMIHREIEKEVLPYCQKEKITVLAWAPLGEGALTGKYSKDKTPKDAVREHHYFFRPRNIEAINGLVKQLEEVGKAHGKSAPQVALNWLLKKDRVVPIPGAKTPKQAEHNAGAFGWDLTSKELSRLNKAIESLKLEAL